MHRFASAAVGIVGGIVVGSVVGSVVASTGCLDVDVPPEAQLSCATTADCPAELICDDVTRFCVDRAAGGATSIDGATLTPRLLNRSTLSADGVDVVVEVAFDKAPRSLSSASLATARGTVASFDDVADVERSDDRRTLTLRGRVAGTVAAGDIDVVGTFVDDRGLSQEFRVANVGVVDFTDPVVLGASMTRVIVGDAGTVANEIGDPSYPVSRLTDIQVTVVVDEALVLDGDDAPTLTLGDSGLTFSRRDDIDAPLIFSPQWPSDPAALAAIVDGTYALTLSVTDLAGNRIDEDVIADGVGSAAAPVSLTIDQTPPTAPAVDVDGAVVFERAPWGRAELDDVDVYTVVGAAGSVEADTVVVVSRDPEGLREIGRFRADNDGSFGGIDRGLLATGDARTVYVRSWDRAGNASDVVAVRDVEWIASPGGKIVGDTLVNPHRFERMSILASTLAQGDVEELGGDDVGAVDGVGAGSDGAGSFARISTSGSALGSSDEDGVLVDSAFGHDPVRGISLLYGGRLAVEEVGSTTAQTCSATGTSDLFVRRRGDQHWQRIVLDVDRPRPTLAGARFVFDTRHNTLLLVGADVDGVGELWDFDGTAFTPRVLACSTAPDLASAQVAFDLRRQVLVARDGGGTWELGASCWQQRCVDNDCAGGSGALVFDDERGAVVAVDTQARTMSTWNAATSTWTPVCDDEACRASWPPSRSQGAVGYDRQRQRLVLFGGAPAEACSAGRLQGVDQGRPPPDPMFGDTWFFRDGRWSAGPANGPAPRSRHAFGQDETRGVFVVVAGDDCNCLDRSGLRSADTDTWELDGSTWQQVDPTPPPATSGGTRWASIAAPAMRDHRMTDDPQSGGILVVGDGDIDGTGSTREPLYLFKQGRFFRSVDVEGPIAAGGIGPFLAGVTTGPDDTVFVFGGGASSGGPVDGDGFMRLVSNAATTTACALSTPCGQRLPPTTTPLSPLGAAVHHDGAALLMFSGVRTTPVGSDGFRLADGATAELFAWTTTTGWQQRCTSSAPCAVVPPARVRGLMSATDVPGETMLYGGGLVGGGLDGDVWVYDGDAFVRVVNDVDGPVARQEHLLVYDDERGAAWMTSGIVENRTADNRAASSTRGLDPRLEIVWEWVDGAWHAARVADVEGDGRPTQRSGAAAARDVDGGIVVHGGTRFEQRLFGGTGNPETARLGDTWRWQGGAETRPAQRFAVQTLVAGIDDVDTDLVGAEVRWHGAASDGSSDVPVALLLWVGTHYQPLTTTTACGAGCTAASIDAALVRQAIVGAAREIVVVAAPLAVNGLAPRYAHVETDYVEVVVRSRR